MEQSSASAHHTAIGALLSSPSVKEEGEEEQFPFLFGYFWVPPKRLFNFFMGFFAVGIAINVMLDVIYLLQDQTEVRAHNSRIVKVKLFRRLAQCLLLLSLVFQGVHWRLERQLNSWYCTGCDRISSKGILISWPKTRWFFGACGEVCWHSVYAAIFVTLFLLVSLPFTQWIYYIDVEAGFINTFESPQVSIVWKYAKNLGMVFALTCGKGVLVLPFLRCRCGWVVPWLFLNLGLLYFMSSSDRLAAQYGLSNVLPNASMAVAHGFPPLHKPGEKTWSPEWMSANRIYYLAKASSTKGGGNGTNTKNKGDQPGNEPVATFVTKDTNRGKLELSKQGGRWLISGPGKEGPYAKTARARGEPNATENETSPEELKGQAWTVNGRPAPTAHVEARKAGALRGNLLGFARDRDIGVDEVYMAHTGHVSVHGNAFATGIGSHRIVALYDTLFLGSGPVDKETAIDSLIDPAAAAQGEVDGPEDAELAEELAEDLLSVDTAEQRGEDPEPLWHRAATEPMTDDEIRAVMGHELGHCALKHVEGLIGTNFVTTLVHFGVLAWMAHSPLLAAAFSFSGPGGAAGLFVYQHVAGPPLETFVELVGNSLVRANEYDADTYGASISKAYAQNLESSLMKLTKNSNGDPDMPWIYELFHLSHPTLRHRVDNIRRVASEKFG